MGRELGKSVRICSEGKGDGGINTEAAESTRQESWPPSTLD
jgi:hypothetical protein